MANRLVNRDRRRSWRYYRILSRLFLYLGVLSAVGATPVLIFTLTGLWSVLWLLIVLLVMSVVFFAIYAYVIGKIRQ
jgi:hypothetical protein